MTEPTSVDHSVVLKQGALVWNEWRKANPGESPNLIRADLRNISLDRANLDDAKLLWANLEGASLSEASLRRADVSYASLASTNLGSADLRNASLHRANLDDANLEGANLEGARLSEARLRRAHLNYALLSGTDLYLADFREANLSLANLTKADLRGAELTGASLTGANLAEADIRFVRGMLWDSTFIRNARFSPRSSDPWSKLRSHYTGHKLAFHLLLLILFVIPYAAETIMWLSVNRVQQTMVAAVEDSRRVAVRELSRITARLDDLTSEIESSNAPGARAASRTLGSATAEFNAVIDRGMTRLARVQPCFRKVCRESRVWRELLAWDESPTYWLLAIALLFYNLCRAILTVMVSPLREEEDRSGYSPPFRYDASILLELSYIADRTPARRARNWVRRHLYGYAWLLWPHRVVNALLWVAVISLLVHVIGWLKTPIWLPG